MLTDCPACKKKISDKADVCNHCGFAVKAEDAEALLRKQKMDKYQHHQSLQTQSFIAVLLFLAGFGMMYWGTPEVGSTQHSIAILVCVLGFIWYLINRVRILLTKRNKFFG
ncbi:MAG: hypothetical protein ACPG4R_05875 [Glaciecola sp.]|jgi:hypothetical protein